jgi:ABC-type phosphate/phosphonate transport system substrate-binding protein
MLCQELSADEVWADPGLLLSQCCGADVTGAFAGVLRVVATPCYRAPGCAAARYASLVVVTESSAIREIEDLRGRVAAINHPNSHSGMNALRALVAPLSRDGRFFSAVKVSGAHSASVALVASGEADVAALDCVSRALLARQRPAALAGTRVLCRTASAPAPPFVTRADAGEDLVLRLRAALRAALAEPELSTVREQLLLDGIEVLPPRAYRRITAFARLAARRGYPLLR